MAILKDLLYRVSLISIAGDVNVDLSSLCFDSRESKQGCFFFAIKGTQVDGHRFIGKAIEGGARAVLCEVMPEQLTEGVTYVLVENSARAFGIVASNFFGNPSEKMKLVAVTGTNGKTTCVTLLFQLFRRLGYNTGLLSTVQNQINEDVLDATHTTPDALQLNALLQKMLDAGCTHCFMEASSHAIVQERIAGLKFAGAIFTNISHDHLDYHGTFEAYINAKKQLFDGLPASAFALVNADDKRGAIMVQNTKAKKKTFSTKSFSDYKAKVLTNSLQGLELDIDGHTVWFKLIGEFNARNLMAAYGTAISLGEDQEEVLTNLSYLAPAKGRFEQVANNLNVTAIVDYAHTPDALENVLKTISDFRTGNEVVITVVGSGGDRDKDKRPKMASIAAKLSDKVILTSDNPRNEDPVDILKDMQKGISGANYKKTLVIPDRKEAIKTACLLANPQDIILVAGKGHENYQEIKGVKYPFDDKEVLEAMFKSIND